jgi:hypothetical protein
MATKPRVERPSQTIKANVKPLDNNIKVKVATAFNEVINRIKEKHLS